MPEQASISSGFNSDCKCRNILLSQNQRKMLSEMESNIK